MRIVGFSTGAVALGDFRAALQVLTAHGVQAVELSALRAVELPRLLADLENLDLSVFQYVSIHAPSSFEARDEASLVRALSEMSPVLPVVVHPDAIHVVERWRALERRLLLENMDRRKSRGRTAEDLDLFLRDLPEAGLCFDVGHARQVDSSMTEAYRILDRFGHRLRELHVSSVGSDSRHYRLDYPTFLACRDLCDRIPEDVPLIIESRVDPSEIEAELCRVREAFEPAELPIATVG